MASLDCYLVSNTESPYILDFFKDHPWSTVLVSSFNHHYKDEARLAMNSSIGILNNYYELETHTHYLIEWRGYGIKDNVPTMHWMWVDHMIKKSLALDDASVQKISFDELCDYWKTDQHKMKNMSNLLLEQRCKIQNLTDLSDHNLRLQHVLKANNSDLLFQKDRMVQNLSCEIDGHKRRYSELQNELESKYTVSSVCVCAIIAIAFFFIMLVIANIYYCILKKAQKHRLRRRSALVDLRADRKDESSNVQKRVKGEGNHTILGRFDVESFSDVMVNLPAVQDAVIDGIMNEMETEHKKKHVDLEMASQTF